VNAPVACSEKRAKNPTHRANDDGSQKGIPKSLDLKRGNDLRHEKQEEGIHHKNKKPHCDNDKWQAQKKQKWSNKGVNNSQEK
jgi:hypothetical protein